LGFSKRRDVEESQKSSHPTNAAKRRVAREMVSSLISPHAGVSSVGRLVVHCCANSFERR
jgi:hypothetical protein